MSPSHIALAVLVAAVWGFNFVVIAVGLDNFPPLLFSALRFLAASLPFLIFVRSPKVPWRWVLAIGLVLGVAKFSFLFVGIDIGMPAGLASLVLQTQAFFTVLFAVVLFGDRPRPVQLAGMAVAFSGIGLIASSLPFGGTAMGLLLTLAAAAAWGLANICMKQARPPDLLALMVWVSAVPPLPLLALSWWLEGPEAIAAAVAGVTWTGVAAVAYIGLVSTVLGFAVWGYLLRTYTAALVAPFSLLVPIFGMTSAALFLGEALTPVKYAAAALVFAGLALTLLPRRRAGTQTG
ncbi:MAG TPA: EamA family transporter [Alphaproteobacteria bacterium]|nr:EamA family transporter [Alphaproteobacteria bacterium]